MARALETLEQAARARMIAHVGCGHCGRTARFLARDLAATTGRGRTIESLRFRCSGCGLPARSLSFELPPRSAKDVVVWRPQRMRWGGD